MPAVDMPIEKLRTYLGTNPRPYDFDEYWERALDEMRITNPEAVLVPAEFQTPFAECFHLYFTGVGGARIHAKYIKPKGVQKPHPAVLMFHGYARSSDEWYDKLGFAAAGISVAAMDCRGQGGCSEDAGAVKGNTLEGHIIRGLDDSPDKLMFRQIFLDTVQLASVVMGFPEVDEDRVGAMGGSQGGGLTLACASLEPRIRRLAPTCPFLSDYKRVWEMDLVENAYVEIKKYFMKFDPTHAHDEETFTKLGYIDIQHLAVRIKGQVLMGTGLMDRSCPPSTQFAVYNKITAPKDVVIYPDFGHDQYPGFQDRAFSFLCGL